MKSRLLGGITALVLAVIGTLMLVNYVSGADVRAQASLNPVNVVVVETSVPAGTTAEELKSHVRIRSIPSTAKAPDALSSLADSAGLVTSVDLQPGEQLLSSRLIDPAKQVTPGAVQVPAGLQEVTVLLPPESVVGGTLRAGDLVGIFVTQADPAKPDTSATQLIFDKVLVTAVQQAPPSNEQTAQGTSAIPSGSTFVTFARNSTDSAKIILSARTGNIWLTKQTAKTPASPRTPVSTAGIFQ